MIENAFINIWNKRVGAISWDPDRGLGSFQFDPGFNKNGWDLAPIKMPATEAQGGRIFSFPELSRNVTFKGLPGMLADILPDKYGNALINAWLARNGRQSNSLNPVEMLCFIGKRGMGALEVEPTEPKTMAYSTKVELGGLVNLAEEILSDRKDFTTQLSKGEEKALYDILKIGTSAGGARAKAVIAFNPDTNDIRSGQANAPKGFSHWLIKLDGVTDAQFGASGGYGRVEMAYYNMARAAGIEMTECRLLEENGRAHFMTKRFDREHGKGKIHVQSFCALRHFDYNDVGLHSYEQLFETMRMLRLPYPEADQMYRRMVFNVMSRNCDDHTKNFAFMMDKTGIWKLTPAFDVCHAYRPGSTWVSQHALTVNGKRKDIGRSDLLEVAYQMNVKRPEKIIDEVAEVVSGWTVYADQVAVDQALRDAIGSTLVVV